MNENSNAKTNADTKANADANANADAEAGASDAATLHYIYDPFCGWCYGLAPY